MSYDGPSINAEQEVLRKALMRDHSTGSAWALIRFEPAKILYFVEEGNFAVVQTEDGKVHSGINVQTPTEFILFMYGELEKIHDIPCLIIYRGRPTDGYVIVGNINYRERDRDDRQINKPFYM